MTNTNYPVLSTIPENLRKQLISEVKELIEEENKQEKETKETSPSKNTITINEMVDSIMGVKKI